VYKLHDDLKDKDFELELSWVCDESKRKFVKVPEELRRQAVELALAEKAKEDMDDSEDEQ
jgi:20S proteasome subunit alpha 7